MRYNLKRIREAEKGKPGGDTIREKAKGSVYSIRSVNILAEIVQFNFVPTS